MHYFVVISTQILTLCAVVLVTMGHDWITEGWGLHPIMAGAFALSCVLAPWWLAAWQCRIDREYDRAHEQETIDNDWLRLHPLD